jgi:hypothetical protein
MTQGLDYARPTERPTSRLLAVFAHLTLSYPLFLIGSLYGEWFLAWHMLGHEPQASLNDPKYINGSSWMHPITGIAIMGLLPAAAGAPILNTMYVFRQRLNGRRLVIRFAWLSVLWLGMLALLRFDPHGIMQWWFD